MCHLHIFLETTMHHALLLSTILLVSACAHTTQLTSGAEYLAATGPSGVIDVDADIARIAGVEPNLRFPAQIGVARIVNGELTVPGKEEGDLLADLVARHPEMGRFVPISPLIAEMVTGQNCKGCSDRRSVTTDIRRAAARQHLDHVLIYEIGARSSERDTPFALADVTLISGALLPTRKIKVEGIGQAILLDVRNGYPYGTAAATEDLSGLSRSFGTGRRSDALREKATARVAAALLPEMEAMLVELYAALKK
jgi:hypothetical protein